MKKVITLSFFAILACLGFLFQTELKNTKELFYVSYAGNYLPFYAVRLKPEKDVEECLTPKKAITLHLEEIPMTTISEDSINYVVDLFDYNLFHFYSASFVGIFDINGNKMLLTEKDLPSMPYGQYIVCVKIVKKIGGYPEEFYFFTGIKKMTSQPTPEIKKYAVTIQGVVTPENKLKTHYVEGEFLRIALPTVINQEYSLFVNGVQIAECAKDKLNTYFEFVMPGEDVVVDIKVVNLEISTPPVEELPAIDVPEKEVPSLFIDNNHSYSQSVCVSEHYLFMSYSPSCGIDNNDYVIRKYDLEKGELLQEGTIKYNHANGMTYNKYRNELIVVGLNGNASQTTSVGDIDYSLFVVDADTLALKEIVNLKEIVLSVNPGNVGISGVAFNKIKNEYYILTRYPQRYVIVLNEEFSYKSHFFMLNFSDESGTRGDISCDENYIYSVVWLSPFTVENQIDVYTTSGEYVTSYHVNGVTHIEGIDKNDDFFYLVFIDFSKGPSGVVYKMRDFVNIS